MFAMYRKKALQPMRPYVPGEDVPGLSVADGDILEEGGMIARNAEDPTDQWYVSREFFEKNYELVK